MEGWSCIINADIVLLPETFRAVELALHKAHARSATSFRYEFDPHDVQRRIRRYDMGLDIFCALPEVWGRVAQIIPPCYRIGHGVWDTWMVGYFNLEGQPCYDFTGSRCVLHPKHESRVRPFDVPDVQDQYRSAAQPPRMKISVRAAADLIHDAVR